MRKIRNKKRNDDGLNLVFLIAVNIIDNNLKYIYGRYIFNLTFYAYT